MLKKKANDMLYPTVKARLSIGLESGATRLKLCALRRVGRGNRETHHKVQEVHTSF